MAHHTNGNGAFMLTGNYSPEWCFSGEPLYYYRIIIDIEQYLCIHGTEFNTQVITTFTGCYLLSLSMPNIPTTVFQFQMQQLPQHRDSLSI